MRQFVFKDRLGEEWDVTVTFGAARRIDSYDFSEITDKKISLMDPPDDFFTNVITSTSILMTMIWVTIYPQAEERNVTAEEFRERLDGESIQAAKLAFWRSLADFFPPMKTVLLSLIEQYQKIEKRALEGLQPITKEIQERMEQLTDEKVLEETAHLREMLLTGLGTASTDSQPS